MTANIDRRRALAVLSGCAATLANCSSSLATAPACERPPTSTPATCVPSASSRLDPAKSRPTTIASATRTTPPQATMTRVERLRLRRRLVDVKIGESARTGPAILQPPPEAPAAALHADGPLAAQKTKSSIPPET